MFRLFALGLFAKSAAGCQAEWAQCGGQNWTGETCCQAGLTCQGGQWWMSCLQPVDVGPTPEPTANPTPSPTPQPDPTEEPTPSPTQPPSDGFTSDLNGPLRVIDQNSVMGTFTPEYTTKDTFDDLHEDKKLTYYDDFTGAASFSEIAGTGNCAYSNIAGLPAFENVDDFVAVSKTQQYEYSLACGMCVEYRGLGGSNGDVQNPIEATWQKAMVVDSCPACKVGEKIDVELDLALNTGDGNWNIEWRAVECDVGDSKFEYVFNGSSDWNIKIQVRNTKVPIYKVEMKGRADPDDISSPYEYKEMRRSADNHFLATNQYTTDMRVSWQRVYGKYTDVVSGESFGTYTPALELRITSIFGEVVEDEVNFVSGNFLAHGEEYVNSAGVLVENQPLSWRTRFAGNAQFLEGKTAGSRRLELIAPHWS